MHSLWCIGHATLVMVTLQSFGECSNLTYELPLRRIWFRSLKTSSQDNLSLNLHSINVTNPTSSCVCVCVCVCTCVCKRQKGQPCSVYEAEDLFNILQPKVLYYDKSLSTTIQKLWILACFPGLVGIVKTKWNLEVAKILVLKKEEK